MSINSVYALDKILASMRSHAVEGNVAIARRLNEQAITIFLDAVFAQDRESLAALRDRFAAFRSEMRSEIAERDQHGFSAALDANLEFATIASRRRPTGIKVELGEEASDAREGALKTLKRYGSLTTGDLADKVGVRKETMSRVLTALKGEGLVTSRRAGRSVMSRLTPRGRDKMTSKRARRLEIKVTMPAGLDIEQTLRDVAPWRVRNAFAHGPANTLRVTEKKAASAGDAFGAMFELASLSASPAKWVDPDTDVEHIETEGARDEIVNRSAQLKAVNYFEQRMCL